MILVSQQIRAACTDPESGIRIEPFEEGLLQPASYDLRVGSQAAAASSRKRVDLERNGFVEILPGDFVIVTTHEKLSLDALHTARFGLTGSFARRGLIATVGPQVDPGFRGRLVVGLTNLSSKSVSLSHRAVFLTIEFHRLERETDSPYSGPYQDRDLLTQEDISAAMDREYTSQTEMMRTLEALVTTVNELKEAVSWRLPMTNAVILAVFLTLFAVLFRN